MAKRFSPLVLVFIGCFIQGITARPAKNPTTLLQILPNTEEIIVQAGDDVTITCIGDQYLSWEYSTHSYSHPDELRHDIDNRLMIDSYMNDGTDYPNGYTHISTVRILNSTFLDTGYITCLNEDDELVRIYVYVRDPNHLWSIIPTPTSSRVLDVAGGTRVIIPCRPTDPTIAVLLKESNVQVYPSRNHRWVAYDPREGFVIGAYPFRKDTEFECIAQLPRVGKTETFSFYVRVDDNLGGSYVPPSTARETSEEVTFLGPDLPSLPEASFQDMLPLSVSELVAPEPVYDKKAHAEPIDQSFFGYQQDSAEIHSHPIPAPGLPEVYIPVQAPNPGQPQALHRTDGHFVEEHPPLHSFVDGAGQNPNQLIASGNSGSQGTRALHRTDGHFVEEHPPSHTLLGSAGHHPNQLVAPVHTGQPAPDYVDYVLDADNRTEDTTTETSESDITVGASEAELVDDSVVTDSQASTTAQEDDTASIVPTDDLLNQDYLIIPEETSSADAPEVREAASVAPESEDTTEAVEESYPSSYNEGVEESTPAIDLPSTADAHEGEVSTVAKEVEVDDPAGDLLGLDDLIIPDEEVDDFLKIQFTTTTEYTVAPARHTDDEVDPYDTEALESKIVKSVAFTVGTDGQGDHITTYTTPQAPTPAPATPSPSTAAHPVFRASTATSRDITTVRAVVNPVQAASRPSARELLTQGEIISSGTKNCEHSSNGRKSAVECHCNTTTVKNIIRPAHLPSETVSSMLQQGNGGGNVLTLQPTVTRISTGETKIGGRVQFECTIEVSDQFDLTLEWSYPQSISKQRIQISPQTVTHNGDNLKRMRSVLTNTDFQRGDIGPYVCMPTLVTSRGPAGLVGPRPTTGNGHSNGHSATRINGHHNGHRQGQGHHQGQGYQQGVTTVIGPRPVIVDKTSGRKVVGGNFILECSAGHTKADTLLELLWKIPYHVEKSGRSSITPNSERNGRVYSTLTVRNLQLSDKGNYTCIAEEIHPENGLLMSEGGSMMQLE